MPEPRLQRYLHEQHTPYETIHHARAVTAQETAASAHIRGSMMAKTVMVKLDGRLAMVVVPAAQRVHFGRLRQAAGAATAELATEAEFCSRFPDCEAGAMPPFGNLYDLEVYVDDALVSRGDIAFNAGTHTEVMRMPFSEFERLVAPKHIHLSHH
ncbi:MAG TPA: YbaK/EbsC family protein [Mizugakiibacter sp.]